MRRTTATVVVGLLWVTNASGQTPAEPPSIIVRGEGRIQRAPEVAWITINTTGRGEKSDAARKGSAEAMTTVQSAIRKLGVPDAAVRTLSYNLQQEFSYEGNQQKFRGFVASNRIEVKVEDITKVVSVIDAAAAVNTSSIDQVRFDVKDPKAASKEALRIAVVDALASARAIASGAGKTMGEILKVQEDGVTFPNPFNLQMASAVVSRGTAVSEPVSVSGAMSAAPPPPPPTPIVLGDITIVARVVVMVAIR